MAFTVRDFADLVRLLREHPEWREELRALLLSAELLSLPELLREIGEKVDRLSAAQLKAEERLARLEEQVVALAQAQARTEERLALLEERLAELAQAQARTEERLALLEERLAELAQAQARTEERLAELAQAQARTEERLALLEERLAELAQAQARTEERLALLEERLAELAQAQARTEAALEKLTTTLTTLVEAQRRTEADVGDLKGISLELRWRERAPAYLAKLLRRARLIPDSELLELLDSERARALLSEEEREDLLLADFVVWGRRKADEAEVYLVGEVSWVVDCQDVERARRRADLLARLGFTAVPVVAGRTITEEADYLAREKKVLRFLDGIYHPN